MKKRSKPFDPHVSLNELIIGLEKATGIHPGEPQNIAVRIDAAVADFRRGLLALHQSEGDSSGVEVLLGDLERIGRRAVRTAKEFGATAGEVPHG